MKVLVEKMRWIGGITAAASLSIGSHVALLSELGEVGPRHLDSASSERARPPAVQVVSASRLSASKSDSDTRQPETPHIGEPVETEALVEQPQCRPPAPDSSKQPPGAPFADFVASTMLDMPALPKSAPEMDALNETPVTGLPIKLRLFINKLGTVAHIEVLQASEDDAQAVEQLKEIFKATAFVAGQKQGEEVDSYKDIEVTLNQSL